MSLDMLKIVCAVEEESRKAMLIATKRVQDAKNEAQAVGEETVKATLTRAESEIAHLMRASNQKATEAAKELASTTANRLATQRARAERRMDSAVLLIVERIVNS